MDTHVHDDEIELCTMCSDRPSQDQSDMCARCEDALDS